MDSAAYETIQLESEGPIAVLTLNRPERLNAINGQMKRADLGPTKSARMRSIRTQP